MRNQLIGLSIFFAALSFTSYSYAAEGRYIPMQVNGEWEVFDTVTGISIPLREFKAKKAEEAARGIDTLPTTRVETPPVKSPRGIKVLEPKTTTSVAPPQPKQIEIETGDDNEIIIPPGGKKPQVQQSAVKETTPVKAQDPNGAITDEMRKRAFTEVSSYRSSLSLIQTVQIQGGRIKGTIAVTNKGKKKLDLLELTLFVPLGDGLQFEEHHFMFGYKAGLKPPPAPNDDPDAADPQIMIVDFPAPAGGGKAKVDLKVSYLKFTEE